MPPSQEAELLTLLGEERLLGATLLVFANKQDLPNALSVTELTEKLGLNTLRRKVSSTPFEQRIY